MGTYIDAVLSFKSGWFARRKPSTGIEDRGHFPQIIELVPGKLQVTIFSHDAENGPARIPCWSFVSKGLLSHHQKEIIVTLQRPDSVSPDDYPRELLRLFTTQFSSAQQGRTVDIGDITVFSKPVKTRSGSYGGLGYTRPEGFVGVEMPQVPLIAGILLRLDEAQVAREFGLTRVLALLGLQNRYYPHPTWSDLRRRPVATLAEMQASAVHSLTGISVLGSFCLENYNIRLLLNCSSAPRLANFLHVVPPSEVFALHLLPDPHADMCAVWSPALPAFGGITREGGDASRITGNFLAFAPHVQKKEILRLEDGYVAFISSECCTKIRHALESASDHTQVDGNLIVSIHWQKDAAYKSAITNEVIVADGWTEYTPDLAARRMDIAVSSAKTVLLTSEPEIQARATIEDLGSFMRAIGDTVEAFFITPERRLRRELVIHVEALPNGTDISLMANPELSKEEEVQLRQLLLAVQAPRVTGLVKFEDLYELWSATTSQ